MVAINTSNLTLDLTVNTDFAQVEADDQQVNLTRFSLFFPEKRLGHAKEARRGNFQLLFFRIGLTEALHFLPRKSLITEMNSDGNK